MSRRSTIITVTRGDCMTSGTDSTRTQSHSLNPLARLLSLCQRHDLPLSLLAIQIKGMNILGEQLGGERLQRLQRQLARAIHKRTRQEDALISWQRGYLVLCLPGTDAPGAAALAGRLQGWFVATRFTLDEFSLQLNTAMAVHVADLSEDGREQQIRELLMDTLCLLAAHEGRGPALSRRAQERRDNALVGGVIDGERRADLARTSALSDPHYLKTLLDKLSDDRQILVRTLSPALRKLDESTRMLLVDHLLEASLIPSPAGSH